MAHAHTDWTAIVAGICAMGAAADSVRAMGTITNEARERSFVFADNPRLPSSIEETFYAAGPRNTLWSSTQYSAAPAGTSSIIATSGASIATLTAYAYRDGVYADANRFTSLYSQSGVGALLAASTGPDQAMVTATVLNQLEVSIDEPTAFSIGAAIWADSNDQYAPPSAFDCRFSISFYAGTIAGGIGGPPIFAWARSGSAITWRDYSQVSGELVPGSYVIMISTSLFASSGSPAIGASNEEQSVLAASTEVYLSVPAPATGVLAGLGLLALSRRRRSVV